MPFLFIAPLAWLAEKAFIFITYFGARKLVLLAAFASVIALVSAAFTLLVSEIDAFIGSVLPSSLSMAAPFIPDNMAFCLSSIVSAHLACTAYSLAIKFIRWKASFIMA